MKAFKETALALAPAWRELFFTLHRCPELGRQEHRTAKLIRERLEALGIEKLDLLHEIPDEYFYDTGHMDYETGALYFTETIEPWLKEEG